MRTRDPEARALFTGIATHYDQPAEILSFGQYARWRRALVAGLPLETTSNVLDVATGTGLIAREIRRRHGCSVIGVDLTEAMLAGAHGITRAAADANTLPFADSSFDALTFSYLFRYVEDPHATLRELVRVVKPGGALASVEFGVPDAWWARTGWRAYALHVFPTLARAFGARWHEVAAFLAPNIVAWARGWPVARQVELWRASGVHDVRVKEMTWGTGVVMWGRKG
jgi:demethylmenaquinone methyltransferase/2-methoxy-6-polyprenyl-1,4-benzoquinol methylase